MNKQITTHCIFTLSLVAFCALFCQCSRPVQPDPALQQAEQLVWYTPDSTAHILQALDTTQLTAEDKLYHAFLTDFANERIQQNKDRERYHHFDSIAQLLVKGQYANRAEIHYIMGRVYVGFSDMTAAIRSLAQAEYLINKQPNKYQYLRAMLYADLGLCSAYYQNIHEAMRYYRIAEPYIKHHNDPTNQAYFYLNYAQAYSALAQNDSALIYYAKADSVNNQDIQDAQLAYSISLYRMMHTQPQPTAQILQLSHYYCDSLHIANASWSLAQHYLYNEQPDSALHYLQIYEEKANKDRNELEMLFAKELRSLYTLLIGDKDEAYSQCYNLMYEVYAHYNKQQADLVSAYARGLDTQLHNDKINALKTNQLRLWYGIIGLVMFAILLLLIILLYHYRRRLIDQQTTERIHLMQNTLLTEQNMRRERLTEDLRRNIQVAECRKRLEMKGVEITDDFNTLLFHAEANIFTDPTNWESFCQRFNDAHNQCITKWQAEYPSLTTADLKLLILYSLNCTVEQICILLDQRKQSIYNRATRLRQHIGIPAEKTIEEWLKENTCENK